MSTVVYGAVTTKRYAAAAGMSRSTEPPGLGTYLDAMAALVPAEVLAAHAVILTSTTTSAADPATGELVVTVTSPGALKLSFWALLVLSVGLYWLGRQNSPRRGDWLRMMVPPAAFVVWCLLQLPSAYDGAFPGATEDYRFTVGIILAVALSALSVLLAKTADNSPP